MKVDNKKMYHFHKKGVYDNLWYVGNEIKVDENFNSYFSNILTYYNTFVNIKDTKRIPLNKLINTYLEQKQTEETLIRLLKEASGIINETNIFKREKALEEVRLQKYSHLPSRCHSIWVTDGKGKDFWEQALINKEEEISHQLALFEVSLTGTLFKSYEHLLPKDESTYEENLLEADQYWNPYNIDVDDNKVEYLFQGKLKILKYRHN